MFFKSLEIQGFKSFADKTILNFDTRTTAVVGSNGNGKSNISDALRWVMGEQGAKTLRGEKMEDIIFHGTVERKPMGFAKVTLTIDNTDRALSIDADEVAITRKLYRAGEREYFINGKPSRLKDVQELLMGTGLGRDGYSIIGQGRVSEIVSARASQRREIFEEAAGVSLSLHRKAEAEKQLAGAEENITRQRDILAIAEERLPVLKRQSEKAILANELYDEKKELEVSVYVERYRIKNRDLRKLEDELLSNTAQRDYFHKSVEELLNKREEHSNERMKVQAELERFRRSKESVNEEISELSTSIQLHERDIDNNAVRREEYTKQIEKAEQSGKGYDEELAEIDGRILEKQREMAALDEKAAAAQRELDEITSTQQEANKAHSEIESALAAAYSAQNTAESSAAQAQSTLDSTAEQKRQFVSDLSESESKVREYTEERAAQQKALDELNAKRSDLTNRLSGYERLIDGKKRRRDAAKSEFDEVNSDLGAKKQRCGVLRDLEENMLNYYGSTKELKRAAKGGAIRGIHGTVADIISVDERYVVAIETVLQSVMQNIIVDNEDTAKRCIMFLKERNAGRATLYPLTTMKGRSLNEPRLSQETGFEGIASDIVKFDEKYGEIVRNLLGTTVIADDINSASAIAKRYGYKFRIVTLDGQLVNAGGSFTGGSRTAKSDIFSRKHEIETLTAEIAKLKASAEEKNAAYEQYKAEYAKLAIELDGINDEIRSAENDSIAVSAEISRLTSLIEQLTQQESSSRQTIERFDSVIRQQEDIIAAAKADAEKAQAKIAELSGRIAESDSGLAEAAEKLKSISEALSQLRLDKQSAAKDIEGCENEKRIIEKNRRDMLENSDSYKSDIAALDAKDKELRLEIERLKLEIIKKQESLTDSNADIENSVKRLNELELSIGGINRDIEERRADESKFVGEVSRLEERVKVMTDDCDSIVRFLEEKRSLTLTEATEQAKPIDDLPMAESQLADLNKRISALGSVNMDSIEEYRTLSEQYEFQTSQLADIEKSKRELEKLIEQLTGDIKTRFLNSFEEINHHFKKIFVNIFGEGAHAELVLTDPDDVLNSGIEINAAPPGKVIKNLISLSGGEQTMVAITIYLAILQHRPTPFCMLDEVDAALDDINVEKYISYLKQFSRETQLMVITHRRGTIEGCEVLYGVFMQEKGVSRLLRKDLGDEELDDVLK